MYACHTLSWPFLVTSNSPHLISRMLNASPNAAHEALARFSIPASRHALAPHASSFTLITQNIDGLDRRAIDHAYAAAGLPSPLSSSSPSTPLVPPASDSAGSDTETPLLFEMHGHVAGVLCTDYECKHRTLALATPLCPALAGTERIVDPQPAPLPSLPQPKRTASEARAWAAARFAGVQGADAPDEGGEPEIAMTDLPRCARCGSLLRPDIVWFTEVPHRIAEVVRAVEGADVIMVVGTSAVVRRHFDQIEWGGGRG